MFIPNFIILKKITVETRQFKKICIIADVHRRNVLSQANFFLSRLCVLYLIGKHRILIIARREQCFIYI